MPIPTAEQILYVLNDCEPFDLEGLEFCVITGGYRHATIGGSKLQNGEPANYYPFERGELLVLDAGGGAFPNGRKPSKWSVNTFETKDYDAAFALSELIQQDPKLQPGLWEWSDGLWVRPWDQEHLKQQRRQDRSALIAEIGDQD